MSLGNPSQALAAVTGKAASELAGTVMDLAGVKVPFNPADVTPSAVPKAQNNRIDDQQTPGSFPKVQIKQTLTGFHAESHDPNAIGHISGKITGQGEWGKLDHIDKDGHLSTATDGAVKSSAAHRSEDTVGHSHSRNTKGGQTNQTQGGQHIENAAAITAAIKEAVQQATGGSNKAYAGQGDGHQHLQGDQTFTVDGGNMAVDIGGNYTVSAAGKNGVQFLSKGSITGSTNTNVVFYAANNITFKCGDKGTYITLTPDNITLSTPGEIVLNVTGGSKNISLINQGTGRVQLGAINGEATIAGNTVVIKSKLGTKIEAGAVIPPLPWSPPSNPVT